MALDVDGMRLHVSTELVDAALTVLIDAAYADVDRIAGGAEIRERIRQPRGVLAVTSRPIGTVASVLEWTSEAASLTLESDDYEVLGQRTLRRLATGTYPASRWLGEVDVTYATGYAQAELDRIAIALVKLDEGHAPGLAGQSIQTWAEQYRQNQASYSGEREAILATLGGKGSSGFLV